MSLEQEFHLARFIAALRFRTLQFRSWIGGTMTSLADQSKEMIRKQILALYGEEEGEAVWERYKDQPENMWLGESEPQQPGELSTNLLCGAPRRIGTGPNDLKLYTSDNPAAAYQRRVGEWWEGAAFGSLIYYVPLAPNVLLKIERRTDDYDESNPAGKRRRRDFIAEEISVARHMVTQDVTRFLYGDGQIVPRVYATECLERIAEAKVRFAIRYLGYDPKAPKGLSFPT